MVNPGRFEFLLRLTAIAVLGLLLLRAPVSGGEDAGEFRAFWLQGRIVVAFPPRPNEGYIQLAKRLMADPSRYKEIKAFNGGRPVMKGRNVRLPLVELKMELRGRVLRSIHPEDELTERGWAHTVTRPLETLIQLTQAYTGSKKRFKDLARFNGIKNADNLHLGRQIVIPLAWIPRELGLIPRKLKPPLGLVRDESTGRVFATYKLRPKETLYSVILRFTDRERAGEVRRMSGLMVKLNGLRDVKRVPAGRPLKMPIEWISEEYLKGSSRTARIKPPPPPKRKRSLYQGPLHVIIDPGHGGVDPGAVYGKRKRGDLIYEHEVVYDIALRVAGLLEANGVRAHLTVEDTRQRLPQARLSMAKLGNERVRVTPPYIMSSANVSVNMRVYMIDALYRRLTTKLKVPPENVLLISIHGDALAHTLRGAMVYYPDHRLRSGEFRPRGRVYRIRQEAVPSVIYFPREAAKRAHWSSKKFGEQIIRSLRANGVRVGGRRPVRSYYYRDGERTLPAVLRYSRVPNSVLVEVANLNNSQDRRAIKAASARQRIAKGLTDAVLKFKGRRSVVAYSRKSG